MRTMRQSCSRSLSDTYNIYFRNSALLPTVLAAPANCPPSGVWTLDEGRGDATVDDIRNFIVEFMISDASVCHAPSDTPLRTYTFMSRTGPTSRPPHGHCRSVNGAAL